ncbi:MAG: hydroxymethylbilane synthase [Micavibrio aeruginosavorus]|uniref:Porphobilinogen deaminase n=1 Tax=Micavibrio aeruginosavorus TaxID=349221 RepID=A0A7T5R3F1_9BACT|nr:MAG: hydroxymethylbilane synthase [Micavibrio aeruginosavorus]
MTQTIRIGTRGSKLALVQTHMVADALRRAHPGLQIEIKEILTSGDWKPEHGETRLAEAAGGKGLFAKEIERALIDGAIDCGVHSLKDMPSFLPPGLEISHVLPREDPRDVFVSDKYGSLAEMPSGAVIGTSALRRQALVLNRWPGLKVIPLRGNVPTRIEKMRAGQVDALILASAGLTRLGLTAEIKEYFSVDDFLPGAAQGVIGVETRSGDMVTKRILDALDHFETRLIVLSERSALQTLDGSCRTPVGAYAVRKADQKMHLRVNVISPDGRDVYADEIEGVVQTREEAERLGQIVGLRLKARVPPGLLTD